MYQALLNAFDGVTEDTEANNILAHISFLNTAHLRLVTNLEERLHRAKYSQNLRNQLLLVYGSLAMKGSQEVEYRVMDQLIGIVIQYRNNTCDFPMSVILIALGNSGSKLSITPILSFLNNSNDNDEDYKVKMVLKALFKVTEDEVVLSELDKLLQGNVSASTITAVIETLHNGLEHIRRDNTKLNLARYLSNIKNHHLLETLARAASQHNNSDLYSMASIYLTEINASSEIMHILHSNQPESHRQKRDTTDWDSPNPDFEYVASRANRISDEITYPTHQTYLLSKTLGVDYANLTIAGGFFAGLSHCGNIKVFGRVIAVGKVLTYKATVADALFDLRLTTYSGSITAYVKIGEHMLLDIGQQNRISHSCWNIKKSLLRLKQNVFTFSYPVFVYVGYLTLQVDAYVKFHLGFNTNLCIDQSGATVTGALGAISPSIGLLIEGSVIGNLAVRVSKNCICLLSFSWCFF